VLRSRSIAAPVAALLFLCGCQRKPPTSSVPRPFDLNDAMEHWYGRYDRSTQTARANLPDHPDVDLAGSWFAPKDPVDIVVVFDAPYQQAGHPRHVIVAAAVPHRSDKPGRPGDSTFNCFACQPVIGMAVFTLRLNTWVLESENEAVDIAGSRGLPPSFRLVTLGTELHGVRSEAHIEASDFSSARMSLLVPWQDDISRAFAGEIAYSNRNACGPESPMREPCYAWERKDALVSVPGQDYDDLVLSGSGTIPAPQPKLPPKGQAKAAKRRGKAAPPPEPAPAVVPYTAVERLRFRDAVYVPLPDTDTSLPEH
jgi:hypothetical protein